MLKKSILTPVLSGVLAVAVVGSGAYYFMDQKNADKDDESSSQSEKADKDGKKGESVDIKVDDKELQAGLDKAVDKIDEVKSGVADQVDNVTKALSGDLDFSYNASLTVTPGEVMTGEVDLKSVGINASAKQKGENSQFSVSGVYDGKTLATANIIGDRSGGNVYAQVPELSSTYVSVKTEQLKAVLEQAVQAPMQAYTQKASEAMAQQNGDDAVSAKAEMPDFNKLIEVLDTIDADALEKDIAEYAQVVADNFPEGKDAGTTNGEADGVSYELSTKTYDVTQADAIKIYKAVVEKAKDDKIVKDLLDNETVKEMTGSAGSSEYTAALDELLKELENVPEDADGEALSFDVMFDADGNIGGFNMDMNGEGIYAVVTNVGDDFVVDIKFNGGDDAQMTAVGAIKSENDTLNGSIKISAESKNETNSNFDMVYTLKDVKTTDDVMSGTMSFEATADGKTVGMVFTSNSTKDKTDLVFSSTLDGKSIFDIAFILEQTDASDITIPTDAIAIDLETGEGADKYAATLDLPGFEANIKDALGEELFNKIMGAGAKTINDGDIAFNQDSTSTTASAKKTA